MAFKKLDSDAVSSSSSRPLDAFVLQGEDANYRAAHTARGRHIANAYPGTAGTVGQRPVIASPWRSALPMSVWPVSSSCTELGASVRGVATHVTAAGAVKLALAAQLMDGSIVGPGNFVTVSGSVTAQTVDLVLDVNSIQDQVVVVWLVYESFPQTSTAASGTQAGADISLDGTRLDIDNVTFTYSTSKRYQLTFAEDAAGSAPRQAFGYCGTRMIQGLFSSAIYDIIPAMPESMETYSAFEVSLLELGRLEVYGWSLEETTFESLPALTERLRPGGRLRARSCQELYRRGFGLFSRRTRLYSAGHSPLAQSIGNQRWINKISTESSTAQGPFYTILAGDLPSFRVQEDSTTPTTEYRLRYRLYLAYAMSAREALNVGVMTAAEINTFGSGVWNTNSVTPTLDQITQVSPPVIYDTRGQVTELSLMTVARDADYYSWSFDDLVAGNSGLRVLEVRFEEATARGADSARLVEVKTIVTRPPIEADDDEPTDPVGPVNMVYCCGVLMIDEGF